MIPPQFRDWSWAARQTLGRLGRKSEGAVWLKHAYRWIYDQLIEEVRVNLPVPADVDPQGPPSDSFPIVFAPADPSRDMIGRVRVTFDPTHTRSPVDFTDNERVAQQAAEAVASWFHGMDRSFGFPRVHLWLRDGAYGSSLGLSVMAATLATILRLPVPPDVAATGEWSDGRLKPVPNDTLSIKLRLAQAWSFRRMLVVEGQEVDGGSLGLTIIRVPNVYSLAVLCLLHELWPEAADVQVAAALSILDRTLVRGDPDYRNYQATIAATDRFVAAGMPPLVKRVAHDIRSRVYLHAGNTEAAELSLKEGEACRIEFLPEGWLGDYLRWHQAAHHAVLAIDQGRWCDGESEHQRLDHRIDLLRKLDEETRLTRSERLAMLYMRNTRAVRKCFAGRLQRDAGLLRQAWDDLVGLKDSWQELNEHAQQLHLFDGDLHRQHNCCMQALLSYRDLSDQLPEDWGHESLGLWPEREAPKRKAWFDIHYYFRWCAATGRRVPGDLLETTLSDLSSEYRVSYPATLACEAILQDRLGSSEQRSQAVTLLSRSHLFAADVSSRSILTILALRAERLVRQEGLEVTETIKAPEPGTQLAHLAQELLTDPQKLVVRCPY